MDAINKEIDMYIKVKVCAYCHAQNCNRYCMLAGKCRSAFIAGMEHQKKRGEK